MAEIVVRVSLTSAEALANLNAFVRQADSQMKLLQRAGAGVNVDGLANGIRNAHAEAYQLRNAFEAVSHSVRAANGSVSQMLFALGDSMRLAGSKGIGLGGILAELAQIAPLIGTAVLGFIALHEEMAKGLPMEAFLVQENDELKKQVGLLAMLGKLKEAGIINEQQYWKFAFQPGASISMREMMGAGLVVPSKSGGELNQETEAKLAIKKIQDQISETSDEGGKKIQELTSKFEKLKDEATAAGLILFRAGQMNRQEFDALVKSISDAGDAQVDSLVKNLNFENQQKNKLAAEQAYDKGQVAFAKEAAQERSDLEKKLTDETETFVGSRLELAQHEYDERIDLATRLLYSGEVSERDYNEYFQFAINERDKMRQEENNKTIARLEEQRKIEQREIEQYMREDWTQTDAQKFKTLNAAGYSDRKTRGPDPSSFQDQFLSQMVQMQNQWGTMAQQMGKIFSTNLNGAINSTSQAFTKLILGTMTWKQALQSIESTILNDLISAIIKMFEQWVIGQILQFTVGKALSAASVGANAGIAAAESAVWATPATLATIASYGGAAYEAPGLIAMAEGLTLASVAGREFGGSVSAGTPYIVGEKRPELFIPSQSGTILSRVPSSSSFREQAVPGQGSSPQVNMHIVDSIEAAHKRARQDPSMENWVVDVVNRNVYRIAKRA